jgi:hypothetical protein
MIEATAIFFSSRKKILGSGDFFFKPQKKFWAQAIFLSSRKKILGLGDFFYPAAKKFWA